TNDTAAFFFDPCSTRSKAAPEARLTRMPKGPLPILIGLVGAASCQFSQPMRANRQTSSRPSNPMMSIRPARPTSVISRPARASRSGSTVLSRLSSAMSARVTKSPVRRGRRNSTRESTSGRSGMRPLCPPVAWRTRDDGSRERRGPGLAWTDTVHPPRSSTDRPEPCRRRLTMPENVAQKLIRSHLESGEFAPGNELGLRIDQTLTQDATGTLVMLELEALGLDRIRTDLSVQYVDHNLLQTDEKNPEDHESLQSAAQRFGLWFSAAGNGVSHPVHQSRFGKPG